MLKIQDNVSPEAFAAAIKFASRVLSFDAVEGRYELSNLPILSFTPRGYEVDDMRISDFECKKVLFPILVGDVMDAFVSVMLSPLEVRASSLSYVRDQTGFQRAFQTADLLAARDGDYEIKVVEIPAISAYFIWISGDGEWFVDRNIDRVLSRAELESELTERLKAAVLLIPDGSRGPDETGHGR